MHHFLHRAGRIRDDNLRGYRHADPKMPRNSSSAAFLLSRAGMSIRQTCLQAPQRTLTVFAGPSCTVNWFVLPHVHLKRCVDNVFTPAT